MWDNGNTDDDFIGQKSKYFKKCAKQRQSRYHFTITQLDLLRQSYIKNPYPTSKDKEIMSKFYRIPKKKIS
ncbi:MAG: hypothetical protein MHPSP_003847, partial [Paramarteilia canceri]